MNSDLIPSSKSSDSLASEQSQIETSSLQEMSTSPETALEGATANRQQPIPPPSDPMQYRAIGLVKGIYRPSDEQITQGTLIATDGTELNAVLLGRIISLLRNHLDLTKEHLWVVYPRTGQKEDNLHLQIVGVWEPEKLSKSLATERPQPEKQSVSNEELEDPSSAIEDGYFSIRGEIIYQSAADGQLIVKIKQAPRKEFDKPKYFKIKLQGVLKTKAVGQFWDLQVKRQADNLVIEKSEAIAVLPSKPKPGRKPRQGGFASGRRELNTQRPLRKTEGSSALGSRPIPKKPTPKPIKRQKPPE